MSYKSLKNQETGNENTCYIVVNTMRVEQSFSNSRETIPTSYQSYYHQWCPLILNKMSRFSLLLLAVSSLSASKDIFTLGCSIRDSFGFPVNYCSKTK